MNKIRTTKLAHAISQICALLVLVAVPFAPMTAHAQGYLPASPSPSASVSPSSSFAATTPAPGSAIVNPTNNPPVSYTLLEPLPCIQSNGVSCPSGSGNIVSTVNFQQYVQFFFNLIIGLSAVAAVFMIAVGGLQYMTTDSWNEKSDGLKKVQNAVMGLVIVLCSYFFLQLLNPRLVDIPSTLVTPLSINYLGQTSGLLGSVQQQVVTQDTLAQQGAALSAQNQQLINSVATANTNLQNLQTSQQTNLSNLADDFDVDPSTLDQNTINSLCDENKDDPEIAADCATYAKTSQSITTTQTQITTQTALGLMNAQVQSCLSAGAVSQGTSNNCAAQSQGQIALEQRNAYNALVAAGQPQAAKQVEDYGNYSNTMAAINNKLDTLQTSPGITALVNTVSTVNSVTDTALGAYIGGSVGGLVSTGVGATAGLFAASSVNTLMNAQLNAKDQATASTALNNIEDLVNTTPHISDPEVNATFQAQTKALVQALGGNPNALHFK